MILKTLVRQQMVSTTDITILATQRYQMHLERSLDKIG